MDTSTLGQVEPGIETPTLQFVDNLHEPLSHCHPKSLDNRRKPSYVP